MDKEFQERLESILVIFRSLCIENWKPELVKNQETILENAQRQITKLVDEEVSRLVSINESRK